MKKTCVDPVRLNRRLEGVSQTIRGRVKCAARFRWRADARAATLVLVLTLALPAFGQQKQGDLTSESLENLMNIEVTSVSKREQKLSRTASAIFVITAEDIRQSGATNIPDLLRMVPGVQVAQINATSWAVSARGLNGHYSKELLVLVDGRSVYTPTFGGVFWDTLGMPLENIERIEVIRGPGAVAWGANAVNGVINIISKRASETQGTRISGGAGTIEQGLGMVQYGGEIGKATAFRVYTQYSNHYHYPGLQGADNGDGWHVLRGGFRADARVSARDTLMVAGDLYTDREGLPTYLLPFITSSLEPVNARGNLNGGFLQGTWSHVHSDRSETMLQFSYDRYTRHEMFDQERGTFDAAVQNHFQWRRQDVVWGFEYRYSTSETTGTTAFSLNPADLDTPLFSAFVQDEITVISDRLFLTLGTKLERNYYTGFNAMPSARLAWTPSRRQTFWAAASKADRTPAATDDSLVVNTGALPGVGGVPTVMRLLGNPDFGNETAIIYEAGYRAGIAERLSLDFSAYYNDQYHQQTMEPVGPFFETSPPPPHVVLPSRYDNLMHGESHGIEVSSGWKVTDRWTLSPGYAFERFHMHLDPESGDTTSVASAQGSSPIHSAQLRSHAVLGRGFTWDTSAYFVDRLSDPRVPAYTRLDSGLTWTGRTGFSVSLVGQNLLKDRHLEFVDTTGSIRSSLIKRSAYVKLSWQF